MAEPMSKSLFDYGRANVKICLMMAKPMSKSLFDDGKANVKISV
jgi:hypothetical protein